MVAFAPIPIIGKVSVESCRIGARLHFPTDLASFLDLIHEHGDAAYSLMFAYAASHSLLLALFAGYAAHSGALSVGTLIMVCWFGSFAGDVIRFWIGRRFGTRWLGSFPKLERAVQTARKTLLEILLGLDPHQLRAARTLTPRNYQIVN